MEAVDLKLASSVATEISYFDGEMLGKANSPAGVAFAVYATLPEVSVSVTVAPETGLPAASRSTPLQEAGKGAAAVHSDRKMRAAAPSRRIEERMTEELYRWRRTFFRSLRAVKGATSMIVDQAMLANNRDGGQKPRVHPITAAGHEVAKLVEVRDRQLGFEEGRRILLAIRQTLPDFAVLAFIQRCHNPFVVHLNARVSVPSTRA